MQSQYFPQRRIILIHQILEYFNSLCVWLNMGVFQLDFSIAIFCFVFELVVGVSTRGEVIGGVWLFLIVEV
jgi:hypothetical protein